MLINVIALISKLIFLKLKRSSGINFTDNSYKNWPVFIRIISEVDTTGTFKLKKNELRDEGYDINKHNDEIYFMMPNTDQYKKLDQEWNNKINSGQAGY